MIFKSFIRAIFIASLENKRISSLVGNDENTVNSAGSRPHDRGGGAVIQTGQTSTTGYLSITATLSPGSPYIDSCLDLSTTTTSLQRPLSSVPKVAVEERFNFILIRQKRCIKGVTSAKKNLKFDFRN